MTTRTTTCMILFLSLLSFSTFGQWATQWHGFSTARKVNQVSIADQNNVWLLMSDTVNFSQNSCQFSKTSNGGTSWQPGNITLPSGWIVEMLFAISGVEAWACVQYPSDTGGTVFHTGDGGQNWTQQTTATFFNGPRIIHFWDADTGICIGNPNLNHFEIFTTVDGGTQWDSIPSSEMPAAADDLLTYPKSYCVSGDTIWFGGYTTGRIFVSPDKGLHWLFVPFPEFNVPRVVFRDSLGLAGYTDPVTNDNHLYYTTNRGLLWEQVDAEGLYGCYDITLVPGTPATLIGSGENLMISNDWGVTWTFMEEPAIVSPLYSAVSFLNPTTGWVGGINFLNPGNGGIYKYTGEPLSLGPDLTLGKKISLYPNPASDQVTLSWFQEFEDQAAIEIMDVTGKMLLNKQCGSHQGTQFETIQVDRFSTGLYTLRLMIGNAVYYKKLVIN